MSRRNIGRKASFALEPFVAEELLVARDTNTQASL